ncbi:hypothetical protein MTR_8g012665 [Medicago truncatula]|uniref:Uncharacterized protein n=1 Tax=Medicago truncatula TaxID=3880 RepID=A0A072TL27_MEDTR|nr:hypothetical protein MTR_8g012665 [Medicago truncatula]
MGDMGFNGYEFAEAEIRMMFKEDKFLKVGSGFERQHGNNESTRTTMIIINQPFLANNKRSYKHYLGSSPNYNLYQWQ